MTNNQVIKAVAFDLGKVLVDFDYTIAVRRLAARARMRAEEFAQFITLAPLLLKYERGQLSSDQFYAEICTSTGFCGTIDEFAVAFGDIFTPIEQMVVLQRSLRDRGLPTYIFSNTNELAIRHIRKNYPFFSNFSGYILSYEHGSMKPEARFYEVLERESGFNGSEILYLDDRPENIEAGAARGWQVILHEDAAKTAARIRELGLLTGELRRQ